MQKILKSSARVPENLYIKRGADSQISKVIKEMLRPGYISVARQMGKTNLLQNAKKELENINDIIIYLDLSSSKYDSPRQYFRFIIDTILEVQDELLHSLKAVIAERRKDFSTSASSEHDRELRMILKLIPQRLVLILDEVDTLAKSEFSDEIFAQIRSIYFMRSTYSVLEKLTYILSGVIEPTKLIKNKDNSPFNIAEQIYLDDFTYQEFKIFVIQSNLPIEEAIIVEVYDWLSGNPRMTYEVCSSLEDIHLQGQAIVLGDVKSVIAKIYLTDFNSAPVDHIRDIVASNSLIREAVKSVKKGVSITDELKDQLYLYGIVGSKFKSDALKIKNKVIDLALSYEWIIDVETKTKGFYEFGLEQIAEGDYLAGIKFILRYAESPDITEVQRGAAYFSISDAYSRIGDFVASNEYIVKANFDKRKRPYDYYYSLFKQGMNCFSLGLYDDGFHFLDEVINYSPKDINHYLAFLNKIIFKLDSDFDSNYPASLISLNELKEELLLANLPEEYTNNFVSICNYKIALINQQIGLNEEANEYYKFSINNSPLELRPVVFIGLIKTSLDFEKEKHLSGLLSTIVNSGLKLQSKGLLNIEFTDKVLWQAMFILFEQRRSEFDTVLSHVISHYYNNNEPVYKLLYNIGLHAFRDTSCDRYVAKEIFALGLVCDGVDDAHITKFCQASALSLHNTSADDQFLPFVNRAFDHIRKIDNYVNLTYFDIVTFASAAVIYRDRNDFDDAFNYADFIVSRLDDSDEVSITGDVIVTNYLKANILAQKGELQNALTFYNKAYSLRNNWERNKLLLLSNPNEIEKIIVDIEHSIKSIGRLIDQKTSKLLINQDKSFSVANKKIQRNSIVEVLYQNGKREQGKYKKYDSDLAAGKCVLVK